MPADAQRHTLPTDTPNGLLLIISGPSGVGKTTITRAVERAIPDAVFSVSLTTRPKTDKDVDGVDYRFVDDETFERYRTEGGFLECAGVYGRKYGTPKDWVLEQLARGRLVILEIDIQGAAQVKRQIPDAFAVFILPPSNADLLERLRSRRREEEPAIQRRFEQASREIEQARQSPIYDAFIINDNLERARDEALNLISRRRQPANH